MENKPTFSSDLPYPEITTTQNINDAKLLMPVYSGQKSELTAILTYVYQSYVSEEFAELLEGISIVEMHHHELLGRTIFALGGYPIMGGRTYWHGSYVNYQVDPRKFILANIMAEEEAILEYERVILALTDADVKLLIERIIMDEQVHIKLFKETLKTLK